MPVQNCGSVPGRTPSGPYGLRRFNAAPATEAEAALLECYGSRRWAQRLAGHRPYPDLDALLAAADEAGYDLSPPTAPRRSPSRSPRGCTRTHRTPPISRWPPRTPRTNASSVMSS